ncbi:MAG: cytidine deaminase [candidate division Zixibacteria bacterium]|nr:cytidine deaminase [candidate division Zixibacteria bacterium]
MRQSYSPYSKSKVGAALEADDKVYLGTNIENRSYGLTVCAERTAIGNAVTNGARRFTRLAIATSAKEHILPCGACLQVLAEFCDDLEIILVNGEGEIKNCTLAMLYPHPFRSKK